jgi:Uma2 family endonuclease
MATPAQIDLMDDLTLIGLPLPITVRPPLPLSDDDLLALSQRNQEYRIELNAKGELEIMSPTGGKGGRWESRVIRELDLWSEQNGGSCFSSSTGFRLPDGAVFMPDAAWISDARWNALSDREQRKYPPLCPDFVIEVLSEPNRDRCSKPRCRCGWRMGPSSPG